MLEFGNDSPFTLPIHYNHLIQAMIYSAIHDPALKRKIHDMGFPFEKRSFKLFTFSRLNGHFTRKENRLNFSGPCTLVVSSPYDRIMSELSRHIFSLGHIMLGGNLIPIQDIRVERPPEFSPPKKIVMLSPMVMYTTLEKGIRKYTYYFNPWQQEFGQLIQKNLLKKYYSLYEKYPEDDSFSIIPCEEKDDRLQKIIKYKGGVVKGWMGEYEISGSPGLIRLAYDAGIGGKNSQGFGCFSFDKGKMQTSDGGNHGENLCF
ncbi:MAG TPA: CRISPR-associated endoribonuclease Cas6 [Methanolinea sp.]|nr:CRISPR-associated endoribonuclease Cas6 [Methanolinea sp.]HQK56077.1 CRISPR-associated endoribonuclease Cas6 [Methanolinea sp.]